MQSILSLWEFSFREEGTGVPDLFRLTREKKHVRSGATVSTTMDTHMSFFLPQNGWLEYGHV